MTDSPDDRPLDISRIREDDALITAASEGRVTDPDAVAAILQDWAAMCQEGTSHPVRKEDRRQI